ncbi:MAG: hypothetical protein OH337_03885 [Candidatus Parvarchaeota archaeon]|nr:hypothetical protein [Candidatus Haiyanarchaeum thermophilum]
MVIEISEKPKSTLERLRETVKELGEKYPNIKVLFDDIVLHAEWAKEDARLCHYKSLFQELRGIGYTMSSAVRLGWMDEDDIMKLETAISELEYEIKREITEKCGCKKAELWL